MADKPEKSNKLKARLPRGFRDRGAGEIAAERRVIETIRGVYEAYGFQPLETPAFEYTDALGKFLPDVDRPNEGVFSLKDDDEQWLSLRYDLTAPLARHVAANFQNLAKPYRRYQVGPVWRNEKPGPGRYREFLQFDADTVGSASPSADAELLMMLSDTLEALGLERGDYIVRLNSRKLLDAVMSDPGSREMPRSRPRSCGRWISSTAWAKRACGCCWARGARRERRFHQGRWARGAKPIEMRLNVMELLLGKTERYRECRDAGFGDPIDYSPNADYELKKTQIDGFG